VEDSTAKMIKKSGLQSLSGHHIFWIEIMLLLLMALLLVPFAAIG
jgi:hypothetical protein